MESTGKDNTWYWVVGTIVVLAVLYFIFKDNIDRFLGIAKDKATGGQNYSCASTFYVKVEGNKIQNVWTSDEGNTTTPNVKYYKQDVTLTEDGVTNSGSPIIITKDEFIGLCKYKYNPPYEWYTSKAPENTGHNSGRTFRDGGMVVNTNMDSVESQRNATTPSSGGISVPASYSMCSKDVWDDKKSGIHFNYSVHTLGGACNAYSVKNGMNLIKNHLQSNWGMWKIGQLNQQLVSLQKIMGIQYPDLKIGMMWHKI